MSRVKYYITKRITVTVLMVFLFSLIVPLCPVPAWAGSLDDIYDTISSQYPEELQRMKDNGASESDIRRFISAVESELKENNRLTEENIEDAMADAILNLFLSGDHDNVFEAVFTGWNLSISTLMDAYSNGGTDEVLDLLPQSFLAIGRLVKDKILNASDEPGGGGGGGGGGGSAKESSSVADSAEIARQIKAGAKEVSLKMADGSGALQIKAADLTKIIGAGMSLNISCYGTEVSLTIPPEVLSGFSGKDLQAAAAKLTAQEAETVTGKLAAGMKRVSGIFELSLKNSSSVSSGPDFAKPVSLAFSYGESFVTNAEEDNLSVYRYNEETKKWDPLEGTIDKTGKVIICPVTHFSKYTVMTRPVKTFSDISQHWAQSDIEFLASRGIINGASETTFAPNRPVTRGEFATLLVNALGLPSQEIDRKFTDVSPEAWYADSVYRACAAGLAQGVKDDLFAPNNNITRQELAAMAVNALTYKEKLEEPEGEEGSLAAYSDRQEISPWAEKALVLAMENEIMTGRSEKILAPRAQTTRAEAAVIIKRLLSKIE
ncbi:hypothetical protein DCMF_15245 [Candidatus Formimonas warabiya]|uniref:SLH domain-containing protein n=1 Tax=Formimonas warabiya TaxID=1761012 RepID=A0A3G1KU13_FORW1|nr:hypothetical protein DCMF_15245 [Candidatus Formimonas warabiya]